MALRARVSGDRTARSWLFRRHRAGTRAALRPSVRRHSASSTIWSILIRLKASFVTSLSPCDRPICLSSGIRANSQPLIFLHRDDHHHAAPVLLDKHRLCARSVDHQPESVLRLARRLLVLEKIASGAIVDDAEELAKYERLARGTNGFMDFVAKAISKKGRGEAAFSVSV
jgi:hypothetical protein